MTRHDKLWIAAIWVGWAILMSFVFFGCATTVQPDKPKPVVAIKWQDSPWTEFIGKDRGIQMCGDADRMLQLSLLQDSKLENLVNDPQVPNEAKQVIKAQQRGLWQLEEDIRYWIKTNCARA